MTENMKQTLIGFEEVSIDNTDKVLKDFEYLNKFEEVEIGLLNRETDEIFTAMTDKEDQVYMSIGSRMSEDKIVIYSFESNQELFTLSDNVSDKTINREFLKRYKLLKPGAVKRLRKEGVIND